MVTEFSSPSGLPNASTSSPLWSRSESPSSSAGSRSPAILSTAKSVSLSNPISSASASGPRLWRIDFCGASPPGRVANTTCTRLAPATTWALVTM
jgi:hypothetical protein